MIREKSLSLIADETLRKMSLLFVASIIVAYYGVYYALSGGVYNIR